MLFEVFRCEETDTIDSISIAHFIKVCMIFFFFTKMDVQGVLDYRDLDYRNPRNIGINQIFHYQLSGFLFSG